MSLHHLAQHIQSAGRGDDKVLVHMTPKEVGGLQALAMAHGGSLTINPETGLPEAGFLSSLLPMIAGFALGPGGFELMSPMQAALTVGAAGTAMTGSLGKGLMMGLGAYGGAGLGAGLSNMGGTELAQQAYAPQAAQWADVQKNLAAFKPAEVAATTGAETAGTAGAALSPTQAMNQNIINTITKTTPTAEAAVAPAPSLAGSFANPQPALGGLSTPTTGSVLGGMSEAPTAMGKLGAGFKQATGSFQGLKDLYAASEAAAPYGGMAALGSTALGSYYDKLDAAKAPTKQKALIRPYEFTRTVHPEAFDVGAPIYSATPGSSASRQYFTDSYTALKPYPAPGPEYAASGGLMGMAVGGPVETMSAENAVGGNMAYPQSQLQTALYSNPMMQRPISSNVISSGLDAPVDPYTGEQKLAGGGLSNLGGYSDGGRLLKGPGDGVSDSIPAVIGNRQPARLADGEFVVPARIVSELGNGSTEAGARKLYAMMDRVQKARGRTIGRDRVAANTKSEKYLPA